MSTVATSNTPLPITIGLVLVAPQVIGLQITGYAAWHWPERLPG